MASTNNKNTALVTGANGFIGSRVASFLADSGFQVRALVRRADEHPGLDGPGIEQMVGDFTDPATARAACSGVDFVVHCAASLAEDLGEIRRVNVGGTSGLAAAARAAGCRRFVHLSTISVYDWEVAPTVCDETSPLKSAVKSYPHTASSSPYYGLSKAEGERALQAEMERGLPATVFRLGAVLGVHPTSSWCVRVPAKIRQGLVSLQGDGGDLLPWTHVDNVCHAIALALDRPEAAGRVYNVVDSHGTWRDYLEEVRGWFPDAPPAPVIPRSPGEASFIGRCAGDCIAAELGYRPLRTYEEGMAEAGEWWRRQLAS